MLTSIIARMKDIYKILFLAELRPRVLMEAMVALGKRAKLKWYHRMVVRLIKNYLISHYSVVAGIKSTIGENVRFPHLQNIVIGECVKIGDGCTIYQDVTLGQNKGKFPQIGNNVIIYAGAKIIGDVRIGDYSVVGANAVVTKDVPSFTIVAGVPAKKIGVRSIGDEFY